MTAAVTSASLLVTLAALLCSAAALLVTRRPAVALPVLLDLLLAASLLRLALRPAPAQLAGTALLVLVKRLVSVGIRLASEARTRTTTTAQARCDYLCRSRSGTEAFCLWRCGRRSGRGCRGTTGPGCVTWPRPAAPGWTRSRWQGTRTTTTGRSRSLAPDDDPLVREARPGRLTRAGHAGRCCPSRPSVRRDSTCGPTSGWPWTNCDGADAPLRAV